ncbi:MAG: hypothetical protein QOK31_848, partial [Solirubrobacteraceae bacterium]|nr:hypothetical protein [Solirubrobacteraceae bacterium]
VSAWRCRTPLPRILVRASRSRLVFGTATRLRVRLRASSRRCVAGATVRFGRVRRRTDAHGGVVLTVRTLHPGRRRIVATRRGCLPGRTTVLVVRQSQQG